jgi:hypothetical protein
MHRFLVASLEEHRGQPDSTIPRAHPSSLAFSAQAATLCKLARFSEASEAAERATTLEPAWAKGWWRRGIIAEMHKLFGKAHQFYSIAVDLEPNEKTFRKAVKSVEKRLKMSTIETADGKKISISEPHHASILDAETIQKIPSKVVWSRFCADNPEQTLEVYVLRQVNFPTGASPTSEQWLSQGLQTWSTGLRDASASLTVATAPQAREQYQDLLQRGLPAPMLTQACRQLLGGEPYKIAMQDLVSGLGHLGGMHVGLKIEGGIDHDDHWFIPRPPLLQLSAYQPTAVLFSVHEAVREMLGTFGNKAKMSKAVLGASEAFCANLRQPKPRGGEAASPKQVVAYLVQQIRAGHTWNGGVRKYVSLQYRGTILAGALSRLFGLVAECYENEKWAREFMTLADLEFKVNEERSYGEKGSAFLPSFRIGMMMSELRSLSVLHGNKLDGPYSVEASLALSVEIVNMANDVEVPLGAGQPEYCYVQNDVAYRRKALALAHSTIAINLMTMGACLRPDDFERLAIHFGFKNESDDQRDQFAIIAEHYRIAAEAELPDAEDGAIYWWAYASSMTRAGKIRGDGNVARGPYTLGELRAAIAMAEDAELARDVGLFGANKQSGCSHESIAKLTAHHFRTNPDSFVLRQVTVARNGPVCSLKIGNVVICPDFSKYEKKDIECRDDRYADLYDTSEIEKDHGLAVFEGLPSLETLCIRELHKQQCEFAVGETDAGVIQYKAMVAAQERDGAKESKGG